MARDRDVRNAIHDALVATNAFDGVWITGLPEDYGQSASSLSAAAIEPVSTAQEDRWDAAIGGDLLATSTVAITLLVRKEDAQLRDEACEDLVDVAGDALNGISLANLTLPQTAKITGWSWQPPAAPERRIKATYSYQYIVPGWQAEDTTP
jgi:hypothetical protein